MKIQIFKSLYCMLVQYHTALWRCYKIGAMNKLKSAYNIRCLKIFFGYSRHFSVDTQLLLDLGLPSWNTWIINSQSVFVRS